MKKEKGFNKYTIIKNRRMHLFLYSYKNNNIILTIKEKWRKRGKNMRKTSKDILTRLPVLSPCLFTWENWGMPMMLGLDFTDTVEHILTAINTYAIGYCDGAYLVVRPRSDQYAVMVKSEKSMFWFHIDKRYFCDDITISDNSSKILASADAYKSQEEYSC